MSLKSSLKRLILPKSNRFHRLLFGLGRGNLMLINFDHETRLYLGVYEREISGYISEFLTTTSKCFDIGANAGYYSLIFAKYTKGGVLAVEPSSNSYETLKRNVSSNNYKISCKKAFVKSSTATCSTTLDQLTEAYFFPDLIKMDIEGGELDALKGAQKLLSRRPPHLIIEVHSKDLEYYCEEYLKDFGYAPKKVSNRKFFGDKRPDSFNGWLVCRSPNETLASNRRKTNTKKTACR